jgi:hypothetical protein
VNQGTSHWRCVDQQIVPWIQRRDDGLAVPAGLYSLPSSVDRGTFCSVRLEGRTTSAYPTCLSNHPSRPVSRVISRRPSAVKAHLLPPSLQHSAAAYDDVTNHGWHLITVRSGSIRPHRPTIGKSVPLQWNTASLYVGSTPAGQFLGFTVIKSVDIAAHPGAGHSKLCALIARAGA